MNKLWKKIGVALLTLTLLLSFNVSSNAQSFRDLPSKHWAFSAVTEMTNLGVINGYTDGTFKPSNHVTRAEFAKLLVVTLKLDGEKTTNPIVFDDVKESSWSYPYVRTAGNYLTGYKVGNQLLFHPNEKAVREDMAVAIVAASGLSNVDYNISTLDKFSDISNASEGLKKYIAIAVEHGLMNGNANGTFNAKGTLTRAEAAQLMLNFKKAKKPTAEELDKNIPSKVTEPVIHEQYGFIDLGTNYSKYEYKCSDEDTWHKATSRYLHKSSNEDTGSCNNFYGTDIEIREIKNTEKTYSYKVPCLAPITLTYNDKTKQVDLGENWHAYDITTSNEADLQNADRGSYKWVKAPERYIKMGSSYFNKTYLFVRYEEKDKTSYTKNSVRFDNLSQKELTWSKTSKDFVYGQSGYTINEEGGKVYLTVGVGMRSNGGYSVEIVDAHVSGMIITVDVQETVPAAWEATTSVLTYPTDTIELSARPLSVNINTLPFKTKGQQRPAITWSHSNKVVECRSNGHTISEENGKIYLTVGTGVRLSSGYSLKILDVDVKDQDLTITVQETVPGPGTSVNDVLTYPTDTIEISERPNSVVIKYADPIIDSSVSRPQLTWSSTSENFSYQGSEYFYTEKNGKTYLTISCGACPTSGYTINLLNVSVNGYSMTINAKVNAPDLRSVSSNSASYPTATIEVSTRPDSLTINWERSAIDTLTWKSTSKKFNYTTGPYQITTEDGVIYLTVVTGGKKTPYELKIQNVNVSGYDITILVDEVEISGAAGTYYGNATIQLSRPPANVNVIVGNEVPVNPQPTVNPNPPLISWSRTSKNYTMNYDTPKWIIHEDGGKKYLTVGSGVRYNEGYWIEILDVEVSGTEMTFHMIEHRPETGTGPSAQNVYPTATIEVSSKPSKVIFDWIDG